MRHQPARHPGHADFSEDTYRVLSAVDCAVMLDRRRQGPRTADAPAVSGLPSPRHPDPDRDQQVGPPGRHALELLDEIQERIGPPTPLTGRSVSPVISGGCSGSPHRQLHPVHRTAGGATAAPEEHITPDRAEAAAGDDWPTRSKSASCSPPTAVTTEAFLARDYPGAVHLRGAELRCQPVAGCPGATGSPFGG